MSYGSCIFLYLIAFCILKLFFSSKKACPRLCSHKRVTWLLSLILPLVYFLFQFLLLYLISDGYDKANHSLLIVLIFVFLVDAILSISNVLIDDDANVTDKDILSYISSYINVNLITYLIFIQFPNLTTSNFSKFLSLFSNVITGAVTTCFMGAVLVSCSIILYCLIYIISLLVLDGIEHVRTFINS